MPAHCLTQHMVPANTLTLDISFCQASHPFIIASDYLPVIHSNSPSASFSLCTFCCPLSSFRHQEKHMENAGKESHSSFLWHRETPGSVPVGFYNTLVFQLFSNSNPLKRLWLETKYCELKPDDRLEYQMLSCEFLRSSLSFFHWVCRSQAETYLR